MERTAETVATPAGRKRPLPVVIRIALLALGWFLVLLGIAGLALPGLQGILTLALAAAVLSLASRTVHRLLRRLLARWPRALDQMESFRDRIYRFLARDGKDAK